MSARDSDVVVLISGKHRAVISATSAQKKRTDGLGKFDGHTKVHRIDFGKSEPKPGDVLAAYGIPDGDGKCRHCERGKCKSVRVGVMRSLDVSHASAEPWARMRVRVNRKVKNKAENPLLQEFDPWHVAWEIREVQDGPKQATPFFEKFNHVDKLIRQLELEESQAFIDGGNDALIELRRIRKQLFIEMLEKLEKKLGYAHHIAEYVVKLNRIVFPKRTEMPAEILKKWGLLLDELEDIVAERRALLEDSRESSRLLKNTPKHN